MCSKLHLLVLNSLKENLILDGQQRITSILLACLGYMPNKEKFEESYYLADGDDSAEEMPEKKSIKWTFQELLQKDSNATTEIEKQLSNDDRYEKISISLSDEFFDIYSSVLFILFLFILFCV